MLRLQRPENRGGRLGLVLRASLAVAAAGRPDGSRGGSSVALLASLNRLNNRDLCPHLKREKGTARRQILVSHGRLPADPRRPCDSLTKFFLKIGPEFAVTS